MQDCGVCNNQAQEEEEHRQAFSQEGGAGNRAEQDHHVAQAVQEVQQAGECDGPSNEGMIAAKQTAKKAMEPDLGQWDVARLDNLKPWPNKGCESGGLGGGHSDDQLPLPTTQPGEGRDVLQTHGSLKAIARLNPRGGVLLQTRVR